MAINTDKPDPKDVKKKFIVAICMLCSFVGCGIYQSSQQTAPSPSAPAATKRIKGGNRFGCVTESRLDRLIGFAAQDDVAAFKQELSQGILTGDCLWFNDGDPVYVGRMSWGKIQLRRRGETTEYWATRESVD